MSSETASVGGGGRRCSLSIRAGVTGSRDSFVCAWIVVAVAVGAASVGCESAPQPNRTREGAPTEGIPASSGAETESARSWGAEVERSLPEPPEERAKEIDGRASDWSGADFEEYRDRKFVTEGADAWSGPKDAAARVATRSDPGRVYLTVEVDDDTVVEREGDASAADGVVLRLRDPDLVDMKEQLPDAASPEPGLHPEMSFLFTPDGTTIPLEDRARELYEEGVHAATVKTARGYRIEIAVRVESLRQVSSFPVPELAFRVDVVDADDNGDDPTRLSTHPEAGETSEGYSVMELQGWLPYESLADRPPRPDAIGRWRQTEKGWRFESIEAAPRRWRLLDRAEFFEESRDGDVCPKKKNRESRVVEAYESAGGDERFGLVDCGAFRGETGCTGGAASRLRWMHLERRRAGWRVANATSLRFDPLGSCSGESSSEVSDVSRFSLRPLGTMMRGLWAVGWDVERSHSGEQVERSGVRLLHPQGEGPTTVANLTTGRREARSTERRTVESRLYLTDLDGRSGVDICQIRRSRRAECRELNRKCQTERGGEEIAAVARVWQEGRERFEIDGEGANERCAHPFEFGRRRAHLLYVRGGRVGLIRSPAFE